MLCSVCCRKLPDIIEDTKRYSEQHSNMRRTGWTSAWEVGGEAMDSHPLQKQEKRTKDMVRQKGCDEMIHLNETQTTDQVVPWTYFRIPLVCCNHEEEKANTNTFKAKKKKQDCVAPPLDTHRAARAKDRDTPSTSLRSATFKRSRKRLPVPLPPHISEWHVGAAEISPKPNRCHRTW